MTDTHDCSPKRFPDRDEVAVVLEECATLDAGQELDVSRRLAGRAMARRGMGKLVFVDLVDRSGRIQIICDTSRTGEVDLHLGEGRANAITVAITVLTQALTWSDTYRWDPETR